MQLHEPCHISKRREMMGVLQEAQREGLDSIMRGSLRSVPGIEDVNIPHKCAKLGHPKYSTEHAC
jgi:hypothetical protein